MERHHHRNLNLIVKWLSKDRTFVETTSRFNKALTESRFNKALTESRFNKALLKKSRFNKALVYEGL